MKELSKRDLETASKAAFVLVVISFFIGLGATIPFLTWNDPILPYASISVTLLSLASASYFFPKAWAVSRLLRERNLSPEPTCGGIKRTKPTKHPNLYMESLLSLLLGCVAGYLFFDQPYFGDSSSGGDSGLMTVGVIAILVGRAESIKKRWGALPSQPLQPTSRGSTSPVDGNG